MGTDPCLAGFLGCLGARAKGAEKESNLVCLDLGCQEVDIQLWLLLLLFG